MKRIILAALLAASTAAQANWINGNQFLEYAGGSDYAQGFAIGFVTGVASAFTDTAFCVPDRVTTKQMLDISTRFIRNAPEARHESAELLVIAALIRAYPCSNKSHTKMY